MLTFGTWLDEMLDDMSAAHARIRAAQEEVRWTKAAHDAALARLREVQREEIDKLLRRTEDE